MCQSGLVWVRLHWRIIVELPLQMADGVIVPRTRMRFEVARESK